MTSSAVRSIFAIVALAGGIAAASESQAQCCGQAPVAFAQPTVAFYQPATTFHQPVVFQAQRAPDPWYPGKWLGEMNRRIWGVQPRYGAAAPTTFVASVPTTQVVNFAPVQSVGFGTTAVAMPAASFSAPACTTCAMPVTEVTMRPVSACDSCCATSGVTQAVYESSTGCANCGVAPATYEGSTYQGSSSAPSASPPSTYGGGPERAPEIDPNADVPAQRQEAQKSPETSSPEAAPGESSRLNSPETDPNGTAAPETEPTQPATNGTSTGSSTGSSTYFEAPQLFDPSDRAAQRKPAPVRTAVLHRSTSETTLTTTKISWEQAVADAEGWRSAGK